MAEHEDWTLPVVLGVGGVLVLKNSDVGQQLRQWALDVGETDAGWNHMTVVYAAVVAATWYLALKHKRLRPGVAAWFWM